MADVYVYAPTSGNFWSGNCYCYLTSNCGCGSCGSSCAHCMFTSAAGTPMGAPIDLGGGSGGGDVTFWTNSNVQSVTVQQFSYASQSCPTPWGDGVVVKMFSQKYAGGVYIGGVAYQHLGNRTAPGTYNITSSPYWGLKVGTFAPDTCSGNCVCYKGVHTHMERDGGSSNGFSCGQAIYGGGGGTWVYHWVY